MTFPDLVETAVERVSASSARAGGGRHKHPEIAETEILGALVNAGLAAKSPEPILCPAAPRCGSILLLTQFIRLAKGHRPAALWAWGPNLSPEPPARKRQGLGTTALPPSRWFPRFSEGWR